METETAEERQSRIMAAFMALSPGEGIAIDIQDAEAMGAFREEALSDEDVMPKQGGK